MQPRYTALDAHIARQQQSRSLNLLSCFLCGHSRYSKISCFAQDVRTQIYTLLALNQVATIAPQTSLLCIIAIASHRRFENIPANYEQCVEETGVEELPSIVTPLIVGVVTHQLLYREVFFDFC
jgi:hypothetical protein